MSNYIGSRCGLRPVSAWEVMEPFTQSPSGLEENASARDLSQTRVHTHDQPRHPGKALVAKGDLVFSIRGCTCTRSVHWIGVGVGIGRFASKAAVTGREANTLLHGTNSNTTSETPSLALAIPKLSH
uniref:Uncharacterized protein n=1 Tax=Coccidioides posadasii RMSCC 3488 TaxID=454284 RepID=A0A0J6FCL9_COCPO|nr:hypothetical protein CPAG_07072 [Coccidioides posadasii RMSCC 3488]